MTLLKIARDGDHLLCDEHQVRRFVEQGWEIVVDNETVPVENLHHKQTSLVSLSKDGHTRLYEINQVPAAKAQGWVEGGQHGDELEDHDQGPRAPVGKPGPAEGRGTDLGKPGSGSWSGEDPGSHDESPQGSEDLNEEILAALNKLDHKDDDHWTALGFPGVIAVRKILGWDVTSAQIKAVAPDLKRIKE